MSLRRMSRALALTIAVVAVLSATACRPTSSLYAVPDELPAEPGEVVRTARVLFDQQDNGIRATALMYGSTDALGERNVVTGTLLVPRAAWNGPGPRPVIGFAPGSQGMGDRCAPSHSLANGGYYEKTVVRRLLDQGWAVAVTDYEKLGTEGDHTYFIRDAEAHALLDVVRAAQRLPDSGVTADAPVGLMGYSQGGQAASAAAEAAADYAPELNLAGLVAGGVPADPLAVAANLDGDGPGNQYFMFLAAVAVGLDEAYPELELEPFLNEEGQALLEQGTEGRGLCLADGAPIFAGRHIDELTTSNPMDDPAWQARIPEQAVLGGDSPTVPTFQYHGATDQIVPPAVGAALRDEWCAAGTPLTFREYGVDHIAGAFAGAADGTAFLAARFAGEAPGTTCGA